MSHTRVDSEGDLNPWREQSQDQFSTGKRESERDSSTGGEKKQSNAYIAWSLVAGLMMAVTSLLRTIAADTPYSSFFVLSFSYLIVSLVAICFIKWRIGKDFRMSWNAKVPAQDNEQLDSKDIANTQWRFSKLHFAFVCGGGLAEFGTSLFSILAFNKATEFGVNAGLVGVLFPLSGAFVSMASFFLFGEKLQMIQVFGMLVILTGATLIVMFPAEQASSGDTATTAQVIVVLVFSLLGTLCLSSEIILSKALSRRGVDGKYVGFNFLLAEGVMGTICLLAATIAGDGLYSISFHSFWLMIAAGLSGVISISLLQYSVSAGIAGIASSIYNLNVSFFTAMCFFFLNQALSSWQIGGIAVTTLGAIFMSINDSSLNCGSSKREENSAKLQPENNESMRLEPVQSY